ncbi:hypothetical protein IFT75_02950 [Pseudomonas sp. CFBP 8758]|uniref:hypothetical protein n=1 Tax=Pseudomonas sp. CFBP 8758 TaxID=2775286 RepID=UPI001780FDA1|nr:hypothetical protein [Pseudomonas sp. CFBP 8758]MBD8592359.1 hypothetical protein [Pseudomonas sp. CFBP 8758]
MARPAAYMHFGDFDSYGKLDFDKKEIRKAMRKAGVLVRAKGRKLVSKRSVSEKGQYPGMRRGTLRRSITYRVSRAGFLVKIEPQKTADMKGFYPAYLWYGVRRNAKRGKSHRKQEATGPWRIEPRENYMVDALNSSKDAVRSILKQAFADALR